MPLFENSNDIILIIGSIAGAICSVIAAVRLSRCEYVNFCKGLITIKRTIDKKNNETIPSTDNIPRTPSTDNIPRTPSTDTLNNNSVEV
jgi:hypothetical protein